MPADIWRKAVRLNGRARVTYARYVCVCMYAYAVYAYATYAQKYDMYNVDF